jgi:RNA polymerase sigma-70 factor (ECF subfamily)
MQIDGPRSYVRTFGQRVRALAAAFNGRRSRVARLAQRLQSRNFEMGVEQMSERGGVAACYSMQRSFVKSIVRRAGIPPAEVEDAVQDVFCVLLGHNHELHQCSSLRGWLVVVARFVCRNRRRSNRRRARSLDAYARLDCEADGSGLPACELRQTLERALAPLSEPQRALLRMSLLEEWSAREIGELMGVSPNTVSSRLRTARNLARQRLSSDESQRTPMSVAFGSNAARPARARSCAAGASGDSPAVGTRVCAALDVAVRPS